MKEIDTIREAIKDYRIASYQEQKYFEVCDDYELLIGPDGFECALTEPEDRTFYRDLSPVIFELNRLRKALAAISTIDPDAIRRECADRAVAWYNEPRDPLYEHEDDDEYWNNLLRSAILNTEPAREES